MAEDHSARETLETPGNTKAPQLKLKARDALGGGTKGTASWSILKDLKISLVDGGVSILKQGISKLTGAFSGAGLPKAESIPPAPAPTPPQSAASIEASQRKDNGTHPTEPPAVAVPAAGEDETFGFDWLDNLLEELDTRKPPEVQTIVTAGSTPRSTGDDPEFPGV